MNSAWLIASVLLLPPSAVPVCVALSGRTNDRLVAIQFASVIFVFLLALLTFAFDQPNFIDLSLCFALLSIVTTYLFALFYERWL